MVGEKVDNDNFYDSICIMFFSSSIFLVFICTRFSRKDSYSFSFSRKMLVFFGKENYVVVKCIDPIVLCE